MVWQIGSLKHNIGTIFPHRNGFIVFYQRNAGRCRNGGGEVSAHPHPPDIFKPRIGHAPSAESDGKPVIRYSRRGYAENFWQKDKNDRFHAAASAVAPPEANPRHS
jgi:hypothetical protein